VGQNNYGQLGDGAINENRLFPIDVAYSDGGNNSILTEIVAIDAGSNHTLALRNDGTVWACGRNNYGQIGN
jgi:alpha-tubulin suppressor-like RCC1 family protein